MLIAIDDDLQPEERKKLLEILPVIYAMRKTRCRMAPAAVFLGITVTELKLILAQYEDTRCILNTMPSSFDRRTPKIPLPHDMQSDEIIEANFEEELEDLYDDEKLYDRIPMKDPLRNLRHFHLMRLERDFSFNQMTKEEQEKIVNRIKRLYSIN